MNSIAGKFLLMAELKRQFKIPHKSSSDTADL